MTSRTAYDTWHDHLHVDVECNTPWHRLVKTYLDPARDLSGRRVLEIGCGRGGFAAWLATQPDAPRQVVAVDYSATAVQKGRQYARAQGLTGVMWEQGDIEGIAHPDAIFDTVLSFETIEHVPDPRGAVRELFRVLKPGGRLFLTTPNYFGTMGLYRMYLRLTGRRFTEENQPICHPVMLPLTLAWIAGAGFRVTHVDAIGHYLPYPRRPPIRIYSLDRARFMTRWMALHSLVVAEKR
jgi:2-polyprenyl-3-methyl-5-hydroxy-6-metoxy-1,4-benzoquinol methylase